MLIGLNLADKLIYIPSYRGSKYFHGLNYSVGINNETAPDVNSTFFIINSIKGTDFSTGITEHGKLNCRIPLG